MTRRRVNICHSGRVARRLNSVRRQTRPLLNADSVNRVLQGASARETSTHSPTGDYERSRHSSLAARSGDLVMSQNFADLFIGC